MLLTYMLANTVHMGMLKAEQDFMHENVPHDFISDKRKKKKKKIRTVISPFGLSQSQTVFGCEHRVNDIRECFA